MRRLVVPWLLALASGGCGLISSDVTETKFDLPSRSYSFDSATFNVPAGFSQPIPCGAGQIITDCCMPPVPAPAPDCNANMIACEQNENGMDVCTATVPVSQSQTMNLGQEVSSLNSFTGYVNIKIKRISYVVNANTLNLNVPDVILYLAPSGVTDTRDAMKFGTLPAIAAGTTPSGDVMLDPNAAAVLKMYTSNIQNPFNFIAETKVKVSQSPTGKIDLTISGQLAASL